MQNVFFGYPVLVTRLCYVSGASTRMEAASAVAPSFSDSNCAIIVHLAVSCLKYKKKHETGPRCKSAEMMKKIAILRTSFAPSLNIL